MHKGTYAALLALVVLFAVPAATVRAATQMPIGFFDDAKLPLVTRRADQTLPPPRPPARR